MICFNNKHNIVTAWDYTQLTYYLISLNDYFQSSSHCLGNQSTWEGLGINTHVHNVCKKTYSLFFCLLVTSDPLWIFFIYSTWKNRLQSASQSCLSSAVRKDKDTHNSQMGPCQSQKAPPQRPPALWSVWLSLTECTSCCVEALTAPTVFTSAWKQLTTSSWKTTG